jgi:MocE subfamily Rieske [2Fe-2S] domain protein
MTQFSTNLNAISLGKRRRRSTQRRANDMSISFDPIGEKKSRAIYDSAPQGYRDYSLAGPESEAAIKKGLASGQWFVPHIERSMLRRLMERDNYHALRDTALLFTIIGAFAAASLWAWDAQRYGLFAVCFWIYCTFYTSSADSRWHECGHSTAFKTKWLNDALYNVASFMVFREPLVWRFSHARHHTDTDVVGRDPEMDGRPLSVEKLVFALLTNWGAIKGEAEKLWRHACGQMSAGEKTFVPKSEHAKCFVQARVFLAIYAVTIGVSVKLWTPLPAMFVFLPYSIGAWHLILVGVFQHASLEHDVLDHRLNTRTCYVNPISAFIYWNMHYHTEHHLFPMVPYYNLPQLHEALKSQLPPPYPSMLAVYREMIPALIKQGRAHKTKTIRSMNAASKSKEEEEVIVVVEGPLYFTDRRSKLPAPLKLSDDETSRFTSLTPDDEGWVAACAIGDVPLGEVDRFDVGNRTYCVYHAADDLKWYATAGKCTHGAGLLHDGLVVEGNMIECPKHNGCFDFKTGMPKRLPVKHKLKTFKTRVEEGVVFVKVNDGKPKMTLAYED